MGLTPTTQIAAPLFTPGMFPCDINCEWRDRFHHRGPFSRFWWYAKYQACHSIANFGLRHAKWSEPTKTWKIVTSPMHSTVWDGKGTLFDFNYQTFGVTPQECWGNARHNRVVLMPGAELPMRPICREDLWSLSYLFAPVVRNTAARMAQGAPRAAA